MQHNGSDTGENKINDRTKQQTSQGEVMSQNWLKPDNKKDSLVTEILVGWDNPNMCYFAHVFAGDDGIDHIKLCTMYEATKEQVVEVIDKYADDENEYTKEVRLRISRGEVPKTDFTYKGGV